jgi:hypothetical protein
MAARLLAVRAPQIPVDVEAVALARWIREVVLDVEGQRAATSGYAPEQLATKGAVLVESVNRPTQ